MIGAGGAFGFDFGLLIVDWLDCSYTGLGCFSCLCLLVKLIWLKQEELISGKVKDLKINNWLVILIESNLKWKNKEIINGSWSSQNEMKWENIKNEN